MRCGFGSDAKRGLRAERGAVAVELAIILPLLLLLILGGMDLGHMYFIKYLTSNASREGARYGVKYQVNPSTLVPFAPTALAISNYVKLPRPTGLGYAALLGDANLPVTPVTVDNILTVTVTAQKHWWVLGSGTLFTIFGFHKFTNPQTITATTAMALER
jgi:Flp pilus assembly protein TadG